MLLSSCSVLHPRSAHIPQPNEITDNPAMLYNNTVPREQMTLRGVRLGDPRSAILRSRIVKESDGGWIVCDDGARYRVEKDAVNALAVWDRKALDQLQIHSREDINARFGKEESIGDGGTIFVYRYAGGHLTVIWNQFEHQVDAVNVSQ
jgi:hypothetical protein